MSPLPFQKKKTFKTNEQEQKGGRQFWARLLEASAGTLHGDVTGIHIGSEGGTCAGDDRGAPWGDTELSLADEGRALRPDQVLTSGSATDQLFVPSPNSVPSPVKTRLMAILTPKAAVEVK